MQPQHPQTHLPAIVLIALIGSAQAGNGETLSEAMSAALVNNPTLGAAQDQLQATGEDIAIGRAGFFPRLTLQGSASRGNSATTQLVNPVTSNLGLNQDSAGYSATLEQPLFDGLRTYNGVEEAREATRATREDLRAAKQRVLLDTVKAYMAVLRDRATVGLLRKSAGMLAEDLEMTAKLEKLGQATSTDIDQTNARLLAARVNLADSESVLAASESAYEQSTGHAPTAMKQPAVPQAALPGTLAQAQTAAIEGHPELAAARYRIGAAKRAVEKVKADFMPQVSLDASYSRTYSHPAEVTDAGDADVTVQVTLPVSLGGETLAKLRQAKFLLDQRRDEAAAKRRELSAQVASLWPGLAGLRKQADLSHRAALSSDRALQGVRVERKAGEKTALDVLNAEADVVAAKLAEIRLRADLVVSAYALLAATGKLVAEPDGGTSE